MRAPRLTDQIQAVRSAAAAAPQDAALAAAVNTLVWLDACQPALRDDLTFIDFDPDLRHDLTRLCRAMEGLMP